MTARRAQVPTQRQQRAAALLAAFAPRVLPVDEVQVLGPYLSDPKDRLARLRSRCGRGTTAQIYRWVRASVSELEQTQKARDADR